MLRLSEVETRILEALYRYRYLTHSQMAELEIGHTQFLRQVTKKLCCFPRPEASLLCVIRFPVNARLGHVENVYFLNSFGVTVLADLWNVEPSDLDFRKVTSVFYRDYWHRKWLIDFQLRLYQALEDNHLIEVEQMDRYFDKTGANHRQGTGAKLRTRTRADFSDGEHFLIPDMNCVLRGKHIPSARALYSVEMINGHNAKRVLNQILKHVLAMQEGALTRKYGVSQGSYPVLFLFADGAFKDIIRSRFYEIHQRISEYDARFYFATLSDTAQNVLRCWQGPRKRGDGFVDIITGKPCHFP